MFVLIFVSALYHLIYFYDKALCLGAATETAAVACEMKRYDAATEDGRITTYFDDTLGGIPVYFRNPGRQVLYGDFENICIEVEKKKRGMSFHVEGCMPDTSPEMLLRYKKDRDKKKEEKIGESAESEDAYGKGSESHVGGDKRKRLSDKNDGEKPHCRASSCQHGRR